MGRKTVSHDEFLIERLMKSFHCEDQENTTLYFLLKDISISHIPFTPHPNHRVGRWPGIYCIWRTRWAPVSSEGASLRYWNRPSVGRAHKKSDWKSYKESQGGLVPVKGGYSQPSSMLDFIGLLYEEPSTHSLRWNKDETRYKKKKEKKKKS